ncbi:F-box domain-containing protein [Microsporum canis CBS 113480]|uniref:F-box domain-containing protein n=1 Tax=Arthroderma otae (strain ATCC MYA-4605 / CBS 113480) TaxID=554155 RepID=C5FS93_ARTOC|nr:F-box domain-containing protein [Microsporum canis CBS 113480]EEQ32746.1 F-box domain-containing protein [Microsporum canis CBS 113480]
MITSHLSPVDVACLALCNHRNLSILSRGVWDTLDTLPRDRERFLKRLQRDLPSDYVNPSGPAYRTNRTFRLHRGAAPTIREANVHPRYETQYCFKLFHLQLAMLQYYYGPAHGISADSLLFTEAHFDQETSTTTPVSMEARTCDGPCLCLQIQNWALVGARSIDRLILKTRFISVCDHVNMDGGKAIPPTLIRVSEKNRLALVITKWLNLGNGLDPEDIRWKRHSAGFQRCACCKSIWKDCPSLDSITQENESHLLNDRYKESMDRWYRDFWILQGGKRLYPYPLVIKTVDLIIWASYIWRLWVSAIIIAPMDPTYLTPIPQYKGAYPAYYVGLISVYIRLIAAWRNITLQCWLCCSAGYESDINNLLSFPSHFYAGLMASRRS